GDTMREKSCGTVLYTVKDNAIHYLLIKATDTYCGFPKGHVEAGETEHETALRETWEETSIRAEIVGDFRREVTYRMKNGNEKTVVYFLAHYSDQTPAHNPGFEIRHFLSLPLDSACRALTFENTREILRDAEEYIKENALCPI
ncbi:MAG: NUDIX domain-containing protein, partial [Clostridia bacterium]|nr:NUDIX domain-containing protein [Clostridia bacterium]